MRSQLVEIKKYLSHSPPTFSLQVTAKSSFHVEFWGAHVVHKTP